VHHRSRFARRLYLRNYGKLPRSAAASERSGIQPDLPGRSSRRNGPAADALSGNIGRFGGCGGLACQREQKRLGFSGCTEEDE
jgi:hypothetical protein